jgi:hypothetical protein
MRDEVTKEFTTMFILYDITLNSITKATQKELPLHENKLQLTFSPWKSNVRVCMLEVPCSSSLNLNSRWSHIAPHESSSCPRDGTKPKAKGTDRDTQVSQLSFSNFGRQTTSSLSKRHLVSSRTMSFESGASILNQDPRPVSH